MSTRLMLPFLLFAFTGGLAAPASPQTAPASLPKATEKILKEIKVGGGILAGLDEELKVPPAWIEGAKKEGKLRVLSVWDPPQATEVFGPFKERYPFINITYNRASTEERVIKPLVAYKTGRIITDLVSDMGGGFHAWKEASALEDLRNIPNLKNIPPLIIDSSGGLLVGLRYRYWCMAYNTKLVKKEDLPKKWGDLLTNPIWRNGNLGIGNRPELWAFMLWKANGEQWTKDFLTRLFSELKPQLRKEGMNAMLQLLGAGEFYATIPSAEYRVQQEVLEGTPISYTCPEPVPVATSEIGIVKGTSNINSARLLVNWLWSDEGQLAQYAGDFSPPIHKGLQRRELVPFAEEILGKPASVRDPGLQTEIGPKVINFWNELWIRGGSQPKGK